MSPIGQEPKPQEQSGGARPETAPQPNSPKAQSTEVVAVPENAEAVALKKYVELLNAYRTLQLRKAQYGIQLQEVQKTIPSQESGGGYHPEANLSALKVSRALEQELYKEIDRLETSKQQALKNLDDFAKTLPPEILKKVAPQDNTESLH